MERYQDIHPIGFYLPQAGPENPEQALAALFQISQQQKQKSEPRTQVKPKGIPERFINATFQGFRYADSIIQSDKNENKDGKKSEVPVLYGRQCHDFATGKYLETCLLLCGNIGNGKSHLAAATLNKAGKTGKKTFFVVADELFTILSYAAQNHFNKLEIIWRLLFNFDILCIDGLEKEKLSDAAKENLFLIINKAYNECRKLIITTNLSPEAIKELDERVYSRLFEVSIILPFGWKDFRTKEYD